MKLPPTVYSALGGAVAASLVWMVASPLRADREAERALETPNPNSPRPHGEPINALRSRTVPLALEESLLLNKSDSPDQEARLRPQLNLRALPSGREGTKARVDAPPTRAELAQRAKLVEEHANAELEALANRLALTEEQQDRIFPILASSSPAYHPVLQTEGGSKTTTRTATGDTIYSDGSGLKPGAPVTEVENEIYPELNEFQQASLEEEAMDREAWWEDIVGLLEEDLESSTSPGVVAATGNNDGGSSAATKFTDEEREDAADTNSVDDFSDLLFGN